MSCKGEGGVKSHDIKGNGEGCIYEKRKNLFTWHQGHRLKKVGVYTWNHMTSNGYGRECLWIRSRTMTWHQRERMKVTWHPMDRNHKSDDISGCGLHPPLPPIPSSIASRSSDTRRCKLPHPFSWRLQGILFLRFCLFRTRPANHDSPTQTSGRHRNHSDGHIWSPHPDIIITVRHHQYHRISYNAFGKGSSLPSSKSWILCITITGCSGNSLHMLSTWNKHGHRYVGCVR